MHDADVIDSEKSIVGLYTMHINNARQINCCDYFICLCMQVRTKQLGYFKLAGSPIRNGSHSAKRMVASVYTKKQSTDKMLQLKVFLTNAIQDQVQVRF